MASNIFGSSYERRQIGSITFLSSIPEKTKQGIDVSEHQNGAVLAWFERNEDGYYDVTIASDGIIQLPEDSADLFSFCENLKTIDFGNNVDTCNVYDMYGMFRFCHALTYMDLAGFDTRNVTEMGEMLMSVSR